MLTAENLSLQPGTAAIAGLIATAAHVRRGGGSSGEHLPSSRWATAPIARAHWVRQACARVEGGWHAGQRRAQGAIHPARPTPLRTARLEPARHCAACTLLLAALVPRKCVPGLGWPGEMQK